MANRWYSEEMKRFHIIEKMSTYNVYHLYYKGKGDNWNPKDIEWGYVGIAPYEVIMERYRIESQECAKGLRPRRRKVIQMLDLFRPKDLIGYRFIGVNLKKKEALQIEAALRPKGHTCYNDQRIWNEVAGG